MSVKIKSRLSRSLRFISISISIIFIISFLIIGCSEDTVTNHNPTVNIADTVAMYDWSWDTLTGYILDNIYVIDSNNIYMVGNFNGMMYYNGSAYTPIMYNDPTFSGRVISGYNQTNIFISGTRYIPPGPAKPCLKVWNGAAFTTYEFPNDSGDGLGFVAVTGYNKGWCKTLNYIYFYDNGVFTSYYKNEYIGGSGGIYITPNNDIYLFTSRFDGIYDPPSINTVYKFINNDFEVISRDTTTAYTSMNNAYFRSLPYFFRGGYQTINIFNNGNWEPLCNTISFYPEWVSAASIDSVWCYGQGGVEHGSSYWLWNNSKWILESNFFHLWFGGPGIFPPSGTNSPIIIVNGRIYQNFVNYNNSSTYFLKGKSILRKEINK